MASTYKRVYDTVKRQKIRGVLISWVRANHEIHEIKTPQFYSNPILGLVPSNIWLDGITLGAMQGCHKVLKNYLKT